MNMRTNNIRRVSRKQAGFSMVELMVAVTIGLILLAGVSSILVSTKRAYTTQDSNGRLQENARIAMLILTRELRNAGYVGCNIDTDNMTNVLNGGATSFDYDLGNLFEGSDGSESTLTWHPSGKTVATTLIDSSNNAITTRPGTDMFMVRGAEAAGSLNLISKMNNQAAQISIADGSGIVAGEILILSDCSSTDIFQATDNTGGSAQDNIIHNTGAGTPGNRMLDNGAKLSKTYASDAQLMRFKSTIYYIATGASGEPALFRRKISTSGAFTTEELVEGIENLQVLYGEDTGTDRIADQWVTADSVGNWDSVVAVRFGIISRALANLQTADRKTANKALDTKPLDIDGDGNDDFLGTETTTTTTENGSVVKDRLYDRRMFRTTVLLRNFVNKEAS